MTQYIVDDEGFFEEWQATFAGRFLASHHTNPRTPIVDTEMLVRHAPRLPSSLQVATGIWWNVVMQTPAPWIAEPCSQLSLLDWRTLEAVARLFDGVRGRLERAHRDPKRSP